MMSSGDSDPLPVYTKMGQVTACLSILDYSCVLCSDKHQCWYNKLELQTMLWLERGLFYQHYLFHSHLLHWLELGLGLQKISFWLYKCCAWAEVSHLSTPIKQTPSLVNTVPNVLWGITELSVSNCESHKHSLISDVESLCNSSSVITGD